MLTDAVPADQAARLNALRESSLLDSPPEPTFDRLTRLVTSALRVPVALISLVDRDRQFFKSQCGLPEPWATARETPLSHSFCQHVAANGQPLIVSDAREHPLVRENLAIRDLNVIAYAGVPIANEDGYVLGSLCAIDGHPRGWSAEDMELLAAVSAQVSAELQLRAHAQELADHLAQQRELDAARQMSVRFNVHDLRTPLAALLMGLEVVKLFGPLNAEQSEYLAMCQENGKSLTEMINNLLDIGGVEHRGGDALRIAPCRAAEAVSSALQQVQPLASSKSITLNAEVDRSLPMIAADLDKLIRVLVNLLGNSIKFTPGGGAVSVRVRPDRDDSARMLQFAVEDNGMGMENADTIFQEGVKLDRDAATRQSTGMGLAFCKSIVDAHHGRIWFDTKVGEGSTFYFTIPIASSMSEV